MRETGEHKDESDGRPATGDRQEGEADCPLAKSTRKLQGLTKEMKDLLKQVRRDMGACNHCELREGCKLREEFGKVVIEALQEVAAELKLTSY